MAEPTVLLALDGEAGPIADALTRAGMAPVADSPETLSHIEAGVRVDLAVLDCDLPAAHASRVYAALHRAPPVPTLLLFGDELPDYFGDTAASTDEYAVKPLPPDALVYRLQAQLIRAGRGLPADGGAWSPATGTEETTIGEGHVVAVFAPKGGVGKTTVAVNMAVAMREQTRDRVLLFDADVGVGNVTSVLEVPYRLGLADLADSPPSEWTDAAFDQCVATHAGSGLRVMSWGSEPGESELVSVDLLLAAIRWGRANHSYVIVDTHPGYDDRTMAMLTLASEIFLVVTPEVGALRNSAQFLELARQVGLGETVRVVVNRANHGIRSSDIAEALKLPVAATVVSNGPKAVIAANEGTPIITKFPRERISTDLHDVARLVTQPRQAEEKPVARRSWWAALVSRTSNA